MAPLERAAKHLGHDPNRHSDYDDRTVIVRLDELEGSRPLRRDRHLLVRVKGDQVGRVFALSGEPWQVGRARTAELWLDDNGVSRNHARIVKLGEGYQIEDLASANGTYVNGARIRQIKLKDGDLVQFGPSAAFRYSLTDSEQEAMLQQLYDASVTDSLTGAYNREHFDTRMESELSFARRHGTELSLLIFDIDHFKRVNDTFGHPAGDRVLIQLAATIASHLRAEDVLARYGGEEFVVILRGVPLTTAHLVAERFRALTERLAITYEEHKISVTISIGIASLQSCPEGTREALVAMADRRLYAAKHAGRNRVVSSE